MDIAISVDMRTGGTAETVVQLDYISAALLHHFKAEARHARPCAMDHGGDAQTAA